MEDPRRDGPGKDNPKEVAKEKGEESVGRGNKEAGERERRNGAVLLRSARRKLSPRVESLR